MRDILTNDRRKQNIKNVGKVINSVQLLMTSLGIKFIIIPEGATFESISYTAVRTLHMFLSTRRQNEQEYFTQIFRFNDIEIILNHVDYLQ
jgi:hypothetical protein